MKEFTSTTNPYGSLYVEPTLNLDGSLWMEAADIVGSYAYVRLDGAAQDALIAHLIEVRGVGRIAALLRNPSDGNITKQITER